MKQSELDKILADHAEWLKDSTRGKMARLAGAYLHRADLTGADLVGAHLARAYLTGADLARAYLDGATDLPDYIQSITRITPESGAFEAWKACKDGVLVRLSIPADARRSNSTGRKCRAEFVDVIEVIGADVGINGTHKSRLTEYRVGERVHCHEWDDDWREECAGGIHFFMTRYEAEQWKT